MVIEDLYNLAPWKINRLGRVRSLRILDTLKRRRLSVGNVFDAVGWGMMQQNAFFKQRLPKCGHVFRLNRSKVCPQYAVWEEINGKY